MKPSIRTGDLKIGQYHGKRDPSNKRSEAKIQRLLYENQLITIVTERNAAKHITIRVFGYEVQLEEGKSRGRCIDLLGYDKELNLYVIELKKEASQEKLSKVEKQVAEYLECVRKMQILIEKEFHMSYFLQVAFRSIRTIILAPHKFYDGERKGMQRADYYCYFRDRDICNRNPGTPVNIHLWKK